MEKQKQTNVECRRHSWHLGSEGHDAGRQLIGNCLRVASFLATQQTDRTATDLSTVREILRPAAATKRSMQSA